MAEPIRIRATYADGVTEVRVLMPHPMETGLRVDEAEHPIAAHYITEMAVDVEGRRVFAARMGVGVSKDPLLTFRIRGAAPGNRIRVTWTDNRGERRSDASLVA